MQCTINLESSSPEIDLSVSELYSTYTYFYSPTFSFKGESHEAWELVFVNFGEVIVQTPEYEKVLSKGQAFIHVPGEFHKIKANNISCNLNIICFKCSCDKLYDIAQKVIDLPAPLKQYVFSIIDEGHIYLAGKNAIPPCKKKPEFASGQIVKNLTELLLIELIRKNETENRKWSNPDYRKNDVTLTDKSLAEYIINYMGQNLQKKLKLEEIARHVGYSVSYICSAFKKTTDISIINYFIKLRINKSKQLMAEGKMNLRQISEYLDFDSLQYFSAQFKKITGVMPSQYLAYLKTTNYKFDDAMNLKIL